MLYLIVFDVLYLIVFDVLYPSGLLFIIEVSNAENHKMYKEKFQGHSYHGHVINKLRPSGMDSIGILF